MRNDDKHLKPIKKNTNIGTMLLLLLAILAVALGGNYVINLIDVVQSDEMFMAVSDAISGAPFWIQLTVAVLLAPTVEELLFRGLVFRRLNSQWGMVAALLVSSLAFGIYHGNIVQGIYAFALGLVLGLAYYNTGSIVFTVIMHMVANLAPVLLLNLL